MSEATNESGWGRVGDDRTVYVREGDSERAVGSFPDGTPEEALAYFERKYQDLEGQITLLEARIARGTVEGSVAGTVEKLREQLVEPAAVGDLQALRDRVAKLGGRAAELSEQQTREREAAKQEALAHREAIVAEAERLAAQPEQSMRWKDTSLAFEQLFTDWQTSQRSGPHIAKPTADALWKRFRSARQTFDSARRAHFSRLDANNKEVKQRKEQLISQAEALSGRGLDGIPAYRSLLDEWKQAGRASRKLDDQLWARFKAAGDVLYQAKAEVVAQTNEEYRANLEAKEALLVTAADILEITDHVEARRRVTDLQIQWDEIGRIPRESLREVEGRMRAIEDHAKRLEDDHWTRTNPETQARSSGLRAQLEESIAELEAEISAARAAGNTRDVEAAEAKLATQRSWMDAISD